MSETLLLILCGIAGVLAHSLLKLNGLLTDARTANIDFNAWKDYWKQDAVAILLSLLSVGIWFMIFGEVVASYPKLEAFRRVSFVVCGAMGSYIIQLLMSRAKKKIRAVVDAKTNEADGTSQNLTKLS